MAIKGREMKEASRTTMPRLVVVAVVAAALLSLPGRMTSGAENSIEYSKTERLAALENLLAHYDEIFLPATGSTGYQASLVLGVARQRWLLDLIGRIRGPHPELVNYLADRELDPDFTEELDQVLAQIPALAERASNLKAAADVYREVSEYKDIVSYSTKYTPEETLELFAKFNVPGRREDVRSVLTDILESLGHLDSDSNDQWRVVYSFLRSDLERILATASEQYLRDKDLMLGMRDGYFNDLFISDLPSEALQLLSFEGLYQELERSGAEMGSLYGELSYRALMPGQTPSNFLESDIVLQYLDALIDYDERVVALFDLKEVKNDTTAAQDLTALYRVREKLRRQIDLLAGGRAYLTSQILVQLLDAYLAAGRFERSLTSTGYAHLKESVDRIKDYREEWLARSGQVEPLYAAVDVDPKGTQQWVNGGWLFWDWLTVWEIRLLRSEGRIISAFGREWVLPPGYSGRSLENFKDLDDVGAKELVLALDLNGQWKDVHAAWEGLSVAEKPYAVGNHYFEEEDFVAAIDHYSQAIATDSGYAEAYVARGNARAALQQFDQARADYDRAIFLQPADPAGYFARGTLHWILGQLDDASADYRAAVNLDPDKAFLYDRLATVFYEQGKEEEVTALYEKAYRQDPKHEWALLGWLGSIAAQEDFESLSSLTWELAHSEEQSAALWYYSGLAELRLRRYDNARAHLEYTMQVDPANAKTPLDVYVLMAETLRATGLTGECKVYLEEYAKRIGQPLNPDWCTQLGE